MDRSNIPVLRHTLFFLSLGGINPVLTNRFRIRDIISISGLLSVILLFVLMVIQVIGSWEGLKSVSIAVFVPAWGMAIFKHTYMMYHRKNLERMIATVSQFWSPAKFDESIEKSVKSIYRSGYRFIQIFCGWVVFNVILVIIQAIFAKERVSIYVSYRLCDFENTLCYSTYLVWHVFAIVTMLPGTIGLDMLFVVFVVYAYAALEMVKSGLKELNLVRTQRSEVEARKNLGEIVDQHNVILEFINAFNDFMALVLMIQFLIDLCQIVVCWFMLALNGLPPDGEALSQYGIFVCSVQMQLLIYCFCGSLIYDQTLSVSDAAYDVEWFHQGQMGLRKDLTQIIQRSQKVSRLTVGYIYDLNLMFFVSTNRAAVSVFTLMRALSISSGEIPSFD